MKNDFDGLINRLDTDEEITSELENMSVHISQVEIQRGKNKTNPKYEKKEDRTSTNYGTIWKGVNICIIGITEKERDNGAEEILEVIIAKKFPKLMNRYQTAVPGNSKSTKQ